MLNMCIFIRVLQRYKTIGMYRCRKWKIYCNESAHTITENTKSKFAVDPGKPGAQFQFQSQQVETQGEPMVQMKCKDSLLKSSLLLHEASLFILFGPSTDWMRPTPSMKIIYLLKVHQFKCYSPPKKVSKLNRKLTITSPPLVNLVPRCIFLNHT